MIKTSIVHADHVYADWLQTLNIYRQELNLLGRHLYEIREKAILPEAAGRIKEYDDRLETEQKNIDLLFNAITEELLAIGEHAGSDGSWYLEDKLSSQYHKLSGMFAAEGTAVENLKKDFNEMSAALP